MVKQEVNDSTANEQFQRAAAFADAGQHSQFGNQQQSKQYICQQCQKPFRSESSLKRHLKETHSNGVFGCKHCPSRIKFERNMREHYRAKHPGTSYDYEKLE